MAGFGHQCDFLARRDDAGPIGVQRDRVLSYRRMTPAGQGRKQAKPLRFRIVDGDIVAAVAVDQADALKLNEISSRRKTCGLPYFGAAGAEPREQSVPELFGR